MNQDFAEKLYHQVKSPVTGFVFTKHFFQRYVERFRSDPKILDGLVQRIDRDLCMLMFEAASNERTNQVIIQHGGVYIPLMLEIAEHPRLKAMTIYEGRYD